MSGTPSAQIDNGNNRITEIGVGTISVGKGRAEQGDNNAIGPIYRSQSAKTSWPTIPNVTTLYDLFERSVRNNSERRCIGWRPIKDGQAAPYVFHTYKETQGEYCLHACNTHQVCCCICTLETFNVIAERVGNVASALKHVKAKAHGKCLPFSSHAGVFKTATFTSLLCCRQSWHVCH